MSRRVVPIAVLVVLSLATLAALRSARVAEAQMPSAPPPPAAPVDSFAAERDSFANLVLERIAGRENMPAESVFKNIKVMKGVPAGRLVRIMDRGFGHSLGVSCDHCHTDNHWADEDKKPKQVAREMMAMVDTINRVLLPHVQGIQSKNPHVNCGMCHHGTARPGAEDQVRPPGR